MHLLKNLLSVDVSTEQKQVKTNSDEFLSRLRIFGLHLLESDKFCKLMNCIPICIRSKIKNWAERASLHIRFQNFKMIYT